MTFDNSAAAAAAAVAGARGGAGGFAQAREIQSASALPKRARARRLSFSSPLSLSVYTLRARCGYLP